jgi:Mce-associated membrane protein
VNAEEQLKQEHRSRGEGKMSERGSTTTIDKAADLDPEVDESAAEGKSDVGSSDTEPEVRVRRWGSVVGISVIAAVVAISLSMAAVFGWKLHEARAVDSAAAAALDSLDQNFAAVLDGATGEFKDMYSQSSEQLKQLLVDNKAAAQGVVIDAGIKSATATEVEVLLFIDQTVSNTVAPDPRIDRSRVVMTMNLVDGRWLAGKVDLP